MPLTLIPDYLSWHYSTSLVDFLRLWKNYLWFAYMIFSIPELLATLFAPWQRMDVERTKQNFNLEDIAETLATNTVLRIMGAVVRLLVIVIGLGILTALVVLGALALLVWLVLPLFVVVAPIMGIIRMIG